MRESRASLDHRKTFPPHPAGRLNICGDDPGYEMDDLLPACGEVKYTQAVQTMK